MRFALVGVAAVAAGTLWAWTLRWTTDDAYISFRYAANLVDGLGLVFNAGERVEGFTNLLWTLWIAVGLRLGAAPESWTQVWGIASYAAAIGLLAWNGLAVARRVPGLRPLLPLAALLAAAHRDWAVYAVSGLETGAFTLLLLGGFLLATWWTDRPPVQALAGAVMALATLTRPDGLLPAAVTGAFVLLVARPRLRCAAAYALGFAALWVPVTAWRVSYYGELLPNTYYAKSAYLAWYSQGLRYVALYFQKYWALLAGPVLLAVAALRRRSGRLDVPRPPDVAVRQVRLALALTLVQGWYVARVGGDFMFARFLVPAAPWLCVLLELGWLQLSRRTLVAVAVAAAAVAAVLLTPYPVGGTEWRHGVANERAYYSERRVAELDHWADTLARHLDGLPVRVAFYGDEARIVYRAGFPVAVEAHTGLTDRAVARQPLERRGRPGHEKLAPARYLIEERKLHLTFSKVPGQALGLRRLIPEVVVRFGEDVYGQVLHWDPALMAELRRRGAAVPDFPALLDRYLAELPRLPKARVAADYERFRRFYFDHVDDPAREEPLRRYLREGSPAPDRAG